MTPIQALQAIKARIAGDWDSPALENFTISTSLVADIAEILEEVTIDNE